MHAVAHAEMVVAAICRALVNISRFAAAFSHEIASVCFRNKNRENEIDIKTMEICSMVEWSSNVRLEPACFLLVAVVFAADGAMCSNCNR